MKVEIKTTKEIIMKEAELKEIISRFFDIDIAKFNLDNIWLEKNKTLHIYLKEK